MSEELTHLSPETFFRLALERGGLDLEDVGKDLSPEVAAALRYIAASPPSSPRSLRSMSKGGTTRSADPLPTRAERVCTACGRLNQPQDRFCRTCGRPLERPQPDTLDELVEQGHLTPEQADEARAKLTFLQSNYTAGTRYSVFGEI